MQKNQNEYHSKIREIAQSRRISEKEAKKVFVNWIDKQYNSNRSGNIWCNFDSKPEPWEFVKMFSSAKVDFESATCFFAFVNNVSPKTYCGEMKHAIQKAFIDDKKDNPFWKQFDSPPNVEAFCQAFIEQYKKNKMS